MSVRVIRWIFPKLEKLFPALAAGWARRIFFKPFRFPFPESEKAFLSKAESFQIEVNSRKVTCYSVGEGTPVLFVHGWSGRASQFWKFSELFTKYGYRVISFDAPGHGFSSGNSTSVLEFAEIIAFLVDNYKIKTLVGHSLGGVASLLAITRGTPAKNLLMISSPSIAERIISEFLSVINGSERSGAGIKAYIEKMTNQPFESFMALDLIKKVKELNLEIIHDEKDRQVPYDHAEALLATYPKAKVMKTHGLGHNRILMSDEVVAESLLFTSLS